MLRSVKSQIVLATSLIIIVILGATAYFVIDQKIKEINADIYTKAVSFAELTHERVVADYETNYKAQAFANFDRELADIYSLNPDIRGVRIFNYKGETLYADKKLNLPDEKLSDEDLDRVQYVQDSVRVKPAGRVVYLEKTDSGIRSTDFNGADVDPVSNTEQIENVIAPFRDANNALRSYSIEYFVSYAALAALIRDTVTNILFIALFGIVVAIFVGGIVAGRITSPIRSLTEGATKIGSGDLTTRIQVKSRTEIGMLAETFNTMARDLEKSTEVLVEKEKLTRELELAGEIQLELLPKTVPKLSNLDVAASLVSAEAVGGDCYDFLFPDPGNFLFYVGDVTGHGMPAGLVSAINNALVPAFLDRYTSTQDLIVALNRILKMKTRPNVFMTMVMANWNTATASLTYTQAGHDPIVHYKAKENTTMELKSGGMALGMIADLSKLARTENVVVEVGDVLVFYTDGIPEAWANEKELYGMDRWKASIQKHAALATAQEIHDNLIKDVRAFMGTYPQADDITLIVVKRTV